MELAQLERVESAADELFRLRAQAAHVNERARNLGAILQLAAAVLGPNPERSTAVMHGLLGAQKICSDLIAATN